MTCVDRLLKGLVLSLVGVILLLGSHTDASAHGIDSVPVDTSAHATPLYLSFHYVEEPEAPCDGAAGWGSCIAVVHPYECKILSGWVHSGDAWAIVRAPDVPMDTTLSGVEPEALTPPPRM